jgi:GxxExxY protein
MLEGLIHHEGHEGHEGKTKTIVKFDDLSNKFIGCVELPVEYKEIRLDCGYRIDLLVDDRLIVELKSVDQLLKIHEAQVLTYMKLAAIGVGLLINFNVDVLRRGIRRFVF